MDDPLGTLWDAVGAIGGAMFDFVNGLADATGLSLPVLAFLAIFLAFVFLGMTANVRN